MKDDRPSVSGSIGESYRQAQPYVDATWQLVGSIALCTFAGYWLDKRFGTKPWLLVAGSVLGFASGMWVLFRTILLLAAKDKKEKERQAGSGGSPADERKKR